MLGLDLKYITQTCQISSKAVLFIWNLKFKFIGYFQNLLRLNLGVSCD